MPILGPLTKWATTTALLTATTLWLASFFYCAAGPLPGSSLGIDIGAGHLKVTRVVAGPLVYQAMPWHVYRAPTVDYSNAPGFDLVITQTVLRLALWTPVALLTIPSALRWWRHIPARPRKGRCPTCSYDRHALPPYSPCPECGLLSTHS